LFKADLHIHTQYSKDSSSTLEQIILTCQKKEINCIAIADHGAIEGALRMKQMAPFQVIVAEEVLTTRGEIMGMFLKERVPSGLSIEKSIRLIKDQGGLLCTPHPFDRFRGSALDARTMNEIAAQIDVVEVFNARNPLLRSSRQAKQFAVEHHLPGSAGSDAHATYEIGNAYLEIPEFKGRDDFLQALSEARVFGRRASPFSHLSSVWSRFKKII
jgi:predicted metal-dependent phosphoesterase TrpH